MPPPALSTDLYELTMAASYLDLGMRGTATFSCVMRRLPEGRGFAVACGLEDVLDALEQVVIGDAELDALARLGTADWALQALSGLAFRGEVRAVPEGSIIGPEEPLLEVTAPIAEAQLVETLVLNQLSFQTAVASKAARCHIAAAGRIALVEFGLRRAHGLGAGLAASRAAAMVGFAATSNVEAADRFGVAVSGTMAHSYVEAFDTELDAFVAFGARQRERSTFLVDTYDTATGVEHAIEAVRRLGLSEAAIRIDSGDLAQLARAARRRLDGAGLPGVRVIVSGNLDEHALAELVASGAPVDAAGVGTRLAVSDDAPYLETTYKLVAYDGRPVAKRSPSKASLPGSKQVFRAAGLDDVLALAGEAEPAGTVALLRPVMAGGRRLVPAPSPAAALGAARTRFEADLAELPAAAADLARPRPLEARHSPALTSLIAAVAGR